MTNAKSHKNIGICLCKMSIDFQRDFVTAAVRRASERGYKVFLYNAFTDLYFHDRYDDGEGIIFDRIKYDILDGLIILSETIKDKTVVRKIIDTAHEYDLPVVSIDESNEGCYNIGFNYTSAFENIVDHIIKHHNCKTINMMAGMRNNDFSEERINCFKRILTENGIVPDERRIYYGDFWTEPTQKAFDEFMKSGMSMPDAWVCANDTMAMVVCAKLTEYGYSVPDDCIVTGFDGIPSEKYHIPRLTTAKQDINLAGRHAVDTICEALSGNTPDEHILVDYMPIFSHSCGCKVIDYREATGQVIPMFYMVEEDNAYDEYMSHFLSIASQADTIEGLSQKISGCSHPFCMQYFNITLNEQFMNINSYDNPETGEDRDDGCTNHLILVERLGDIDEPPYFAPQGKHLDEAIEKFNYFVIWPVHFQEQEIGRAIVAISIGLNGELRNDNYRYLTQFSRNINHVLEIVNNQTVLKKANAKLQDLYIRDYMTGLYNRRGFYNELNSMVKKKADEGCSCYVSVISVDMDGLKVINDTYGHAEGDLAIKAVAESLVKCWEKDVVCSRFGGDEFIVSAVCESDPDSYSSEIISRINSCLDEYNQTSDKPYKIRCSFGVYSEKAGENFAVDLLIKAADNLMYIQKAEHHERRHN